MYGDRNAEFDLSCNTGIDVETKTPHELRIQQFLKSADTALITRYIQKASSDEHVNEGEIAFRDCSNQA